MILPSLKARVTLPGAIRFSAHVRRPESLKRVGAPKKDTVQCYAGVSRSTVAHDQLPALVIQRPPRPLRPVEHSL